MCSPCCTVDEDDDEDDDKPLADEKRGNFFLNTVTFSFCCKLSFAAKSYNMYM